MFSIRLYIHCPHTIVITTCTIWANTAALCGSPNKRLSAYTCLLEPILIVLWYDCTPSFTQFPFYAALPLFCLPPAKNRLYSSTETYPKTASAAFALLWTRRFEIVEKAVCLCTHTHTHIVMHRVCLKRNQIDWRCAQVKGANYPVLSILYWSSWYIHIIWQ